MYTEFSYFVFLEKMPASSEIQGQSDEALRKEQEQRLDKLNVFLGEHPDVEEGWAPSVDILAINESGKLVIKNGKGEEVRAFGLSLGKNNLKLVRSVYEGAGMDFPPEKDSKLATTEATKLYLQARERRSIETNPLEDVAEEETPEDENNKEPIWYEGIVDDLKNATDPKVKYEERLPARVTLKSHGVDIDTFINLVEGNEERDTRMMMVRDAAFVLGGEYKSDRNAWHTRQEAIDFLKKNFSISQPEEGETKGPNLEEETTAETIEDIESKFLTEITLRSRDLPENEREHLTNVAKLAFLLLRDKTKRNANLPLWEKCKGILAWAKVKNDIIEAE